MKKHYILLVSIFISSISFGQTQFLSEIHLNNGIEITGVQNTSLTGYVIDVYSSFGIRIPGSPFTLTGTFPATDPKSSSYSALNFVNILNASAQNLIIAKAGCTIVLRNGTTQVGDAVKYGNVTEDPVAVLGEAAVSPIVNAGTVVPVSGNVNDPFGGVGSLQRLSGGWNNGLLAPSHGFVNEGLTLSTVKNNIEGFNVYPNPVVNCKFAVSTNSDASKQLKIYSLLGKQVYSSTIKSVETVEVANLNKGIYILKVEQEGKIATRKLVIQ